MIKGFKPRATSTMGLSLLAAQAVKIALYAIDNVTGGALEKAGANVLTFLTKRFQDRLQIEKSESTLLKAAIISEASSDEKFKEELESLVTNYYQIENSSQVSQKTESGVNMNVQNNSGNVSVVGQKIDTQIFRQHTS